MPKAIDSLYRELIRRANEKYPGDPQSVGLLMWAIDHNHEVRPVLPGSPATVLVKPHALAKDKTWAEMVDAEVADYRKTAFRHAQRKGRAQSGAVRFITWVDAKGYVWPRFSEPPTFTSLNDWLMIRGALEQDPEDLRLRYQRVEYLRDPQSSRTAALAMYFWAPTSSPGGRFCDPAPFLDDDAAGWVLDLVQELFPAGEVESDRSAPKIVGESPALLSNLEDLKEVAEGDPDKDPILLLGEKGTGKELFARQYHVWSPDERGRFVPVNCPALVKNLQVATLFGAKKGAYAGCDEDQLGFFPAADKGTIFLDEVAYLNAEAQAALLRVIQERTLTPLGTHEEVRVDLRIVAATNRDLWKMVKDGEFLDDLLGRLSGEPIRLPPLRDRLEDLPALIWHFVPENLRQHFTENDVETCIPWLRTLRWSGNVRQLRSATKRAARRANRRSTTLLAQFKSNTNLAEEQQGAVVPNFWGNAAPTSYGCVMDAANECKREGIRHLLLQHQDLIQDNKSEFLELIGAPRSFYETIKKTLHLEWDGSDRVPDAAS